MKMKILADFEICISAPLNVVPKLIRNTYCTGAMQFYRFVCTIIAQAHISLMTRLVAMPPCGFMAKPWWWPDSKAPGSSKDLVLWNHLLLIKIYPSQPVMKLVQHIFFKIRPKFEFEVSLSMQLCASLTHEDPAYLQITHHYVYFLDYNEQKSFFGHQLWVPKPV